MRAEVAPRSLRDLQRALLVDMLNFNPPKSSTTAASDGEAIAWKILILDAAAQRIISPILKLSDAVFTLIRQLHSDRQPIADVPAVYFVEPSPVNISRICQDLKDGMYDKIYLNFTSSVPRSLLEDLAYHVTQTNSSASVSKIYDQYLDYNCLEGDLFSLDMPHMYVTLNDPQSSDSTLEIAVDKMASSLFSILLTFGGQPPVLCATQGSAAETLATKLETRIRNHLINTKSTALGPNARGEDDLSFQRSVLILLDRDFDVATMLRHVSAYNAMTHDLLGLKLNRVTVDRDDGGKRIVKQIDIDMRDTFWSQHSRKVFFEVTEKIDGELQAYRARTQQITRTTGIQDLEHITQNEAVLSPEELKLVAYILPELTEQKRIIDLHFDISTALLDQLKNRSLGDLFNVEQRITEQTKAQILQSIHDKTMGSPVDKLRLFLVYFFAIEEISKGDMIEYESALKMAGCDLRALEHARRVKAHHRTTLQMSQQAAAALSPTRAGGSSTTDLFDRLLGNRLGGNIKDAGTLMGGMMGNVMASMRNFLPTSADTPITRQVDAAIEQLTSSQAGTTSPRSPSGRDSFVFLDPRQARSSTAASSARPATVSRTAIDHVIVFVVGGSNYAEYNSLQEHFAKKTTPRPVKATFGSTDLLSGSEFLDQFAQLASRS